MSLVKRHCMQQAVRMFFLLLLKNRVNAFVDILCAFNLKMRPIRFIVPNLGACLTAEAKSIIAFPAIRASSWLSLISMLITWTGLLNSPPRVRRSSRLRQKICQVAVLSMLTVADGIKTSFFASYHNIGHCFALLPPLRRQLDMSIPIEHWKEPVCSVSAAAL